MCYRAKFLQLGEEFKLVGSLFGEFCNISYQVTIYLIQFLQEEQQGRKGFGRVGYLV